MDFANFSKGNFSGAENVLFTFTWIDYALFSLLFGSTAIIGIYYGCFGSRQNTKREYLHGGKNLGVLPITMSLMASNLSGTFLFGIPSEVYLYGTQYILGTVGAALTTLTVGYLYLPIFYKFQVDSTDEYLELRFNSRLKIMSSGLYVLYTFLFIPVVIYVPSLAFNQVTGIEFNYIVLTLSVVCIFYTTLGGLKAVVWTDTIQLTITLLVLGCIAIIGTVTVGGFEEVWRIAQKGNRLQFFDMNPDPTLRTTFWSAVMGNLFLWTSVLGCNPSIMQRFLAIPTLKSAKTSLTIFGIGTIITNAICCYCGLIIYAKFAECDPIASKQIGSADQIFPYYVLDVASHLPGISGLFIAGVFCSALSTLSTCLNTLSGIIYTDFVTLLMPKNTSEREESQVIKILVVFLGAFCVTLVFVVQKLGTVLEITTSIGAITGGPILGLFTMGMLFPSANAQGALSGSIASLLIVGWVVIKQRLYILSGDIYEETKPLSTFGCQFPFNSTLIEFERNLPAFCPKEEVFWVYRISFYYTALMGTLITICVGLYVSWLTKTKEEELVDPDLLCPFVRKLVEKSEKNIHYVSVGKALNFVDINQKLNKSVLLKQSVEELERIC